MLVLTPSGSTSSPGSGLPRGGVLGRTPHLWSVGVIPLEGDLVKSLTEYGKTAGQDLGKTSDTPRPCLAVCYMGYDARNYLGYDETP